MSDPSDRTLRFLRALAADPEPAAALMRGLTVELVTSNPTPADEIALALAATLLLRLDRMAPVLSIRAPSSRQTSLPMMGDGPIGQAIADWHVGFSSLERFTFGSAVGSPDIRIVFGSSAEPGLRVSTRGWAVSLGADLAGDMPGNALAAALGGVLASAEVLKLALIKAGLATGLIRPWREAVSLWDLGDGGDQGPDIDQPVDLRGVAFVGAGGIGSIIAWILALFDRSGEPMVVDDDVIDGTSLNRHLTAGFAQVGQSKADLFTSLLKNDWCHPITKMERWQQLEQDLRSQPVAVVTVDNDATRRAVQLDFPELLLNAGTSDDGMYRESRHDFLTGACAGCISRSDQRLAGPLESVAAALGVDPELLRPFARSEKPLPSALLAKMKIVEPERQRLSLVPGHRFVVEACGSLRGRPEEPAVSAPMLSAAPAVLVAADLVHRTLKLDELDSRVTSTSIFTGPHPRWSMTRQKREGCECQDETYRRFYESRWPRTAAIS